MSKIRKSLIVGVVLIMCVGICVPAIMAMILEIR